MPMLPAPRRAAFAAVALAVGVQVGAGESSHARRESQHLRLPAGYRRGVAASAASRAAARPVLSPLGSAQDPHVARFFTRKALTLPSRERRKRRLWSLPGAVSDRRWYDGLAATSRPRAVPCLLGRAPESAASRDLPFVARHTGSHTCPRSVRIGHRAFVVLNLDARRDLLADEHAADIAYALA